MHNKKAIILASASPRRKEILEKTGLAFTVDESCYDEKSDLGLKPHELAGFLSREKAREVARRHRDALIIAADTIVVSDGRLFGKPGGGEEAREMLRALSGKSHSVITGFTILDGTEHREIVRTVETKVFFRQLSPDEIEAYIRTGEPFDKAGAYGIQGLGAVIVERIEGDFFNVMGLPLNALSEGLKEFGINVLS